MQEEMRTQEEISRSCMHDREYNSSGLEDPVPLDPAEVEALETETAQARPAARGGRFRVRTDIRSPNRGGGARGQMFAPFGIVLHHTAGEETSDLRTLTSPAAQVSSNDYITKQGVIFELVPFPGRAWHAGFSELFGVNDWNDHGWGIEIENYGTGVDSYPPEQIDAVVWRCRERRRALGITDTKMLARHRDVCLPRGRKTDTSDNFPYEEVRRRVFAATDSTDDPIDGPMPAVLQHKRYTLVRDEETGWAQERSAFIRQAFPELVGEMVEPGQVEEISRKALDNPTVGEVVCIVLGEKSLPMLDAGARKAMREYGRDTCDVWNATDTQSAYASVVELCERENRPAFAEEFREKFGGEEQSNSGAGAIIDRHLGGNGQVIVAEARDSGLDLALACALVEQESGGRNIFGCDHGPIGDSPPYCHQPVTKERVKALIDSPYMNGIGLTQITWWEFVLEAERMGGADLPSVQCRFGFKLLKGYVDKYGLQAGAAAYNAGEGNRMSVFNTYGASVLAKYQAWKERLG